MFLKLMTSAVTGNGRLTGDWRCLKLLWNVFVFSVLALVSVEFIVFQ